MFRFEHISYLYLLALLPILGIALIYSWRFANRRLALVGHLETIKKMIEGWSLERYQLKSILLVVSFLFMIIALSNPQWGVGREKVEAKGTDVFILFDISSSMMAQDISPSRLERSIKFTSDLIKSLRGNRIGLVFFAGSAFLQMPLTLDYSAADLLLKSANTNQVGTQGTDISAALQVVENAYVKETSEQKAIIIITDGESHDDDALSKVEEMKNKGWFVYTVGVGTEAGAYIPVASSRGNSYKMDENGELIKTSLNTEMINQLASKGNGKAYLISDGLSASRSLADNIDKLQKKELSVQSFANYNSYFQIFLGLGLLSFCLYHFLPDRKKIIR